MYLLAAEASILSDMGNLALSVGVPAVVALMWRVSTQVTRLSTQIEGLHERSREHTSRLERLERHRCSPACAMPSSSPLQSSPGD